MNILALFAYISFFILGLIASGIIYAAAAMLIWHFLPNTRAGKWINDTHGEPVFVNFERAIEVGDCLKPTPTRKGGPVRAGDIMVGGVMCDE